MLTLVHKYFFIFLRSSFFIFLLLTFNLFFSSSLRVFLQFHTCWGALGYTEWGTRGGGEIEHFQLHTTFYHNFTLFYTLFFFTVWGLHLSYMSSVGIFFYGGERGVFSHWLGETFFFFFGVVIGVYVVGRHCRS